MVERRILYVEDNRENRILIKRVLEAEGYTVDEAADGLSGLKMAQENRPDLILLDINLPDIDGYEATKRLRKMNGISGVPVVALTANVMQGDREKSLEAGCDGYIQKPIDVDQLPNQIESYLGGFGVGERLHLKDRLYPVYVDGAVRGNREEVTQSCQLPWRVIAQQAASRIVRVGEPKQYVAEALRQLPFEHAW